MSESVNEESRAAITEPAVSVEPATEATAAPPEMRRKLAHMVPGSIPFVMWLIPHEDPLPLWNLGVVAGVVAVMVLVVIRRLPTLRRHQRESWMRTCLTYALPPLAVLMVFPARAEYAAVVMVVLAFGDSAAAIAGRQLGKLRLPWNPAKTWVGFLAFMLVAGPVASVAFWGEAHPGVPWSTAATYGMVAAVLGAIAESCDWRMDDNIRVSLGALAGILILALLQPTAA